MINIDKAYGAFAGLLVGDAAGAVLEFCNQKITEEMVEEAMKMPGRGVWNIGRGQITDDGELALSLGYALKGKDPGQGFPRGDVFREYHSWFKSYPFDIGTTCRMAFASPEIDEDLFLSQRSEANGALMRIAPLAVWSAREDYLTTSKYAREDARLSHPNRICADANALYCIAISYLLKNENDNQGCISFIQDFIKKNREDFHPKVVEWFQKSLKEDLEGDANNNQGWLYHSFYLSFYHLNKGSSFKDAIFYTLMKGGDTDTNAAIVGGIIGALHGLKGIPEEMLKPVLSFDPTKEGRRRPEKYKPSKFLKIVEEFLGV